MFASRPPIGEKQEKKLNELQKYLKVKTIQRKMIKVQREGDAAGTKDTQVIGPPKNNNNRLPPFTIEQCGVNYGKKRTKEEQEEFT